MITLSIKRKYICADYCFDYCFYNSVNPNNSNTIIEFNKEHLEKIKNVILLVMKSKTK